MQDITFWAVCANTAITALGFCIIKFNDFKHLTSDVKQLSTDIKENIAKTNKLDKKVAVNEKAISTLEQSKQK